MVNHQELEVSEYLLIEPLWNLTMKQISQLSLTEKNMSNKSTKYGTNCFVVFHVVVGDHVGIVNKPLML